MPKGRREMKQPKSFTLLALINAALLAVTFLVGNDYAITGTAQSGLGCTHRLNKFRSKELSKV